MTLTPESRQYATTEEVHDAIQHLQDSDFVKLMIIARSFTKRRLYGAVVGADDLLQEAIAKTLAGRRRWNRDVSIVRHLDRVMESDSGPSRRATSSGSATSSRTHATARCSPRDCRPRAKP